MDRRFSRRRLLAGSVPLVGGLAGCSGGGDGTTPRENDDGTTGDDGTAGGNETTGTGESRLVEFPALSGADPTYRRWQPGTGELRGVQDAAHNFAYAREFREDLPAATYEQLTTWAMFNGYVGIEYGELDGMVLGLSSSAVVYVGSFARSDVTERLVATPYERFETVEGIEYYRWDRSSGTTFVGVGDEGVVAGPGRQRADDPSEAFVEGASPLFGTAAGERPRLHEESTVYEQYTDAIGWPLFAWAGPPQSTGGPGGNLGANDMLPGGSTVPDEVAESVRVGQGEYVTDTAVITRYWLTVTEDGSASPERVRSAYDDPQLRSAVLENADDADLAIRRDGRVVEVAVLDPVSDPGGGQDPPLVAVEATTEGGTLTLEHFAGDPLPLDLVTIRGSGDPVSLGEGRLSPGESVSVEVGEADTSVVVYSPPAADSTTVIAEG